MSSAKWRPFYLGLNVLSLESKSYVQNNMQNYFHNSWSLDTDIMIIQ